MLGLIIRIAVTALMLALILRHVDLDSKALGDILGALDWGLLLAALALQLLSVFIGSLRWYTVMQALRFGHGYPFYLKSFFKGMFFNQALPASIGGDALRILDVAREGHGAREAFYGVATDRVLGLMSLIAVNATAFLIWPELLPAQVSTPVLAIGLAGAAGSVLFVHLHRTFWLARVPGARWVHDLSERLATVLKGARGWGRQLLLGLSIHIFTVAAVWCIGRAVGLEYDLAPFMVIFPIVLLVTVVPISLAGWGVREGAMVGLFLLIGAEQGRVLAMSVLYGVVLIFASLPGLFVYLTSRHRI